MSCIMYIYTYIYNMVSAEAVKALEAEPNSLQNSSPVVECGNGMTLRSSRGRPPRCQALLPHGGSSNNSRYKYRVTWNRSSSRNRRNKKRGLSWTRGLSWKHH